MLEIWISCGLLWMGSSEGTPFTLPGHSEAARSNEGIEIVQNALHRGVLTKELVEENICKASLHNTSGLISFAQNIKFKTLMLTNQVLKKGSSANLNEIENALAALGILQWAGIEGAEVRSMQIRLLALLKVKKIA